MGSGGGDAVGGWRPALSIGVLRISDRCVLLEGGDGESELLVRSPYTQELGYSIDYARCWRVADDREFERRFARRLRDPIVYSDAIPTLGDSGGQPLVPLGALLAIVLASGVIWIVWQREQHRSTER